MKPNLTDLLTKFNNGITLTDAEVVTIATSLGQIEKAISDTRAGNMFAHVRSSILSDLSVINRIKDARNLHNKRVCPHCDNLYQLEKKVEDKASKWPAAVVSAPCCGKPLIVTRQSIYGVSAFETDQPDDDWGTLFTK